MRRNIWIDFTFEVFSGIFVVAAVVFCWRKPFLLSILVTAGLGVQYWFWREKADIAAMAGAALLGTIGETLCVNLGVWTYHAPGLVFAIPFWIPLVWAYLFCFFRRVSITIHSIMLMIWPQQEMLPRRVLFGMLGATILVYSFYTIAIIKRVIAAAYTALLVPALIFWRGEKDILIFLFGAACGTIGEYICIQLGFWRYHYPFFAPLGLPISLPLAWGLSAVIVGRIASVWERQEETITPDET
jgi:hypothetical protein